MTRPGFVKELSEITVAVVDNYQGEENDLILLSLVPASSCCLSFAILLVHALFLVILRVRAFFLVILTVRVFFLVTLLVSCSSLFVLFPS